MKFLYFMQSKKGSTRKVRPPTSYDLYIDILRSVIDWGSKVLQNNHKKNIFWALWVFQNPRFLLINPFYSINGDRILAYNGSKIYSNNKITTWINPF